MTGLESYVRRIGAAGPPNPIPRPPTIKQYLAVLFSPSNFGGQELYQGIFLLRGLIALGFLMLILWLSENGY